MKMLTKMRRETFSNWHPSHPKYWTLCIFLKLTHMVDSANFLYKFLEQLVNVHWWWWRRVVVKPQQYCVYLQGVQSLQILDDCSCCSKASITVKIDSVHYGSEATDLPNSEAAAQGSSRSQMMIYQAVPTLRFTATSGRFLFVTQSPRRQQHQELKKRSRRERETNFDLHKTTITMTKWSRTLD